MRLSSIVSLVVVTASLALGGCAADAEPVTGETQPNVVHSDPNAPAQRDLTQDVGQTGKISDNYANPSDETKARLVEHYVGGEVDPRIVITPSGFDPVNLDKVAQGLPVFHTVSPLQTGIKEDPGYTPYGHVPKP